MRAHKNCLEHAFMPQSNETRIMALYCDFENLALGVRDTNYGSFDINLVLEKLLLKGNIVVKKAYCDWVRYQEFKVVMHEASFELIDIPQVRQSGKNSADIRLVVDALDLCYTKEHVDTFVILSGDSDFSPLVSKLRENNKEVIGIGVKNATSDLLTANCDEFIFYDDLARQQKKEGQRRQEQKKKKAPVPKNKPVSDETARKERKEEAWDLLVETYDDLVEERGEEHKIWGSMLKQTLKRRKPGFNETYYGFRSFGQLLTEAAAEGIVVIERDERSGGFLIKDCP